MKKILIIMFVIFYGDSFAMQQQDAHKLMRFDIHTLLEMIKTNNFIAVDIILKSGQFDLMQSAKIYSGLLHLAPSYEMESKLKNFAKTIFPHDIERIATWPLLDLDENTIAVMRKDEELMQQVSEILKNKQN